MEVDDELTEMLARLARAHGEDAVVVKRGPGRPPQSDKEAKREVHLYIPESLSKKVDIKRGSTPMSVYILSLIEKDMQ